MKSSRWPSGKYVNHTYYACRSKHLSILRKSNEQGRLLCGGLYFLMFSNRFFVDDRKGNNLFTHIHKSFLPNLKELLEYFALGINRSHPSQFNVQAGAFYQYNSICVSWRCYNPKTEQQILCKGVKSL